MNLTSVNCSHTCVSVAAQSGAARDNHVWARMSACLRKVFAPAVAAAALGFASQTASAVGIITVDDFTDDFIVMDSTPGGATMPGANTVPQATIRGMFRTLIADRQAPALGKSRVTLESNADDMGLFSFDQSGSTAQGNGTIIYDGNSDFSSINKSGLNNGAGSGLDLTSAGLLSQWAFHDLSVSGSGLQVQVTLFNYTSGAASVSPLFTLMNGFIGDYTIPYSSFSIPSTASNVGAIQVQIFGTLPGSDLSFDSIQSIGQVPEPSTFALAGMGVLGLGVTAWRRRRPAVVKATETATS